MSIDAQVFSYKAKTHTIIYRHNQFKTKKLWKNQKHQKGNFVISHLSRYVRK